MTKKRPQGLRACRETSGLPMTEIIFQMRLQLPEPCVVTDTTIYRWETSGALLDPIIGAFFAHLYGVDLEQIHPDLPASLNRVRDLVLHNSMCESLLAAA